MTASAAVICVTFHAIQISRFCINCYPQRLPQQQLFNDFNVRHMTMNHEPSITGFAIAERRAASISGKPASGAISRIV
jgi:hypothetical protein